MTAFSPTILKVESPIQKTVYLAALTLGLGLILIGISWLSQLGCAVIILTQLLTGRFARGRHFIAVAGWIFVLGALASAGWQLAAALRFGHPWERNPLPWWCAAFILSIWLGSLITELRQKK